MDAQRTPGNAQERLRTHRSARERHIILDKGYCELPINAPTSTHLPYAIVVADVVSFVMLLWRLFE